MLKGIHIKTTLQRNNTFRSLPAVAWQLAAPEKAEDEQELVVDAPDVLTEVPNKKTALPK
jgi:hypothetical protein